MSIDNSCPGTLNEINQITQDFMINHERSADKIYLLQIQFFLSTPTRYIL